MAEGSRGGRAALAGTAKGFGHVGGAISSPLTIGGMSPGYSPDSPFPPNNSSRSFVVLLTTYAHVLLASFS